MGWAPKVPPHEGPRSRGTGSAGGHDVLNCDAAPREVAGSPDVGEIFLPSGGWWSARGALRRRRVVGGRADRAGRREHEIDTVARSAPPGGFVKREVLSLST